MELEKSMTTAELSAHSNGVNRSSKVIKILLFLILHNIASLSIPTSIRLFSNEALPTKTGYLPVDPAMPPVLPFSMPSMKLRIPSHHSLKLH